MLELIEHCQVKELDIVGVYLPYAALLRSRFFYKQRCKLCYSIV